MDIQAAVATLHQLDITLNQPSAPEALQAMEKVLACTLPNDLAILYSDHDGMPQDSKSYRFPMRLMSTAEAVNTFPIFQAIEDFPKEFRVFWTDDNSNYAAVYVEGPLTGKICFIDHDGRYTGDEAPVYRGVQSFYEHMLQAVSSDTGWYEMPADYPGMSPTPFDDEDLRAALHYMSEYERTTFPKDDVSRRFYAYCAMNLLPVAETHRLLRFLDDPDRWIPDKACELLARRQYEPAVPYLIEAAHKIARKEKHTAGDMPIRVLSAFHTQEVKEALIQIRQEIEPSARWFVDETLKRFEEK